MHLYVFCGVTDNNEMLNSIEKFDARAHLSSNNSEAEVITWQLIDLPAQEFIPRMNHLAAPISATLIAILGGINNQD